MTKAVPGAIQGRPTKYRPEYCEEMIEFFSVKPTEERYKSKVLEDNKVEKITYEGGGVDFPTFTRFAQKIGVCDDTLTEWANVHTDFSVATKRCKKFQEDIWLINALNGNYSSQFSIFLGKNVFGYKDKQELDVDHVVTMMPSVKIGGKPMIFDVGEDKQIEEKDD